MLRRKPAPPPPQDGLLDLLGPVPDLRVAPLSDERAWGALDVKWPSFRGHHACDDCTKAIHNGGNGGSPLAATAKRRGPNGDLFLCPQHAQAHRELDDRAKREYEAAKKLREFNERGR